MMFDQFYFQGCSVFGLESADGSLNGIKKFDQALPDEAGNVVGYSVVKQTCDKNNCNEEHERPVPPQDSLTSSCLSCSVTVDQYNNTNGMGDIGCWLVFLNSEKSCIRYTVYRKYLT